MVALTPVLAAGCGSSEENTASSASGSRTTAAATKKVIYFGWLQSTKQPAGVAIEATAGAGKAGKIRVYVCDGVGPQQGGMAVWFAGNLDPKATETKPVRLSSLGKTETFEIDTFNKRLLKGTFTDFRGTRHQYVAYPSQDGAGIYEVTLDKNLKYTGVSTLGDRVTAQADRESGLVKGSLTTTAGDKIPFTLNTLALAPPAKLKSSGLSTTYRKDKNNSLVPGEYTAVVAPSSTHWLGRAITLARFPTLTRTNIVVIAEIIGLDKKEFTP
jgi:hypothetical protein